MVIPAALEKLLPPEDLADSEFHPRPGVRHDDSDITAFTFVELVAVKRIVR